MLITQSSSAKAIPFYMVDSADHIAAKTGLTPTVTISKNGAAFATPAGAVAEIGSGWYRIAGNATDSNTIGSLLIHATATGADPYDIEHEVVAFNVDSATVTVGTNNDKIGYALTSAYDSAKTAASQANVATELTTYGALKPTTAGRTLDITTTGEAGIDWANIGAPTTLVALSGTTIGTVTTLTNDPPGVTTLLARISSTIFTGITSMKEWLGLIAGKQSGNSTARTEIRSTGAGSGTYDETTDSQEATRDRGDAAWLGSSQASVDAIKAVVDAILLDTGGPDGVVLTNATAQQVADALLKRDWTAVSGEAAFSALNAMRFLRCVWNTTSVPGSVVVKKEDGTTTAWQRVIATDAAAQPIVGVS